MAKLFRHFGLGGGSKKGPSQGASGQECVSKTAGGSAQELRLKSPTKYRSSAIVVSSSPSSVHGGGGGTTEQNPLGGINERQGDFDVRRHSDASSVRSLRPKTSNTDWSPSHNIGGVRPKDSRGATSFSQKVTGRVLEGEETSGSCDRVSGEDAAKNRTVTHCGCENRGNTGRRLNPPERAASVSSLILPKRTNNGVDLPFLTDYSDPFDLKRQNEEAAAAAAASKASQSESRLSVVQSEDEYSVPYEIKHQLNVLKLQEANAAKNLASPSELTTDSDTYADPYEEAPGLFSIARLAANDKQAKADAEKCLLINDGSTDDVASKTKEIPMENTGESPASGAHGLSAPSAASVDNMNVEGGGSEDLTIKESNCETFAISNCISHSSIHSPSGSPGMDVDAIPSFPRDGLSEIDNAVDTSEQSNATYDEPWDLGVTRRGIEDRLKMAARRYGPDGDVATASLPWPVGRGSSFEGICVPGAVQEYDEPWDLKARDIERNLIVAKSAKEAAKMIRDGGGVTDQPPTNRSCRIDERATEEYYGDRRISSSGTVKGVSPHSQGVPSPHPSGGHSPKRKWLIDTNTSPWCSIHAERIDSKIPLEQQGWFHGSISRLDAEALLRVHRDGSFLVRLSESNKSDYSLSFKSPRGFMHMKIVDHDGQLILGQFSRPFDDIPQMIQFFTLNKLPIHGADHMSLLFPVHNELL